VIKAHVPGLHIANLVETVKLFDDKFCKILKKITEISMKKKRRILQTKNFFFISEYYSKT